MYSPSCLKGRVCASQVKMKSREGSGQKEEHEQRLRGKKYHGGLGDIQVLLI